MCKLKAPMIKGGVEYRAGDTIELRPDQAERLAHIIEPHAPAKSVRATRKQET
jgi:uncharacterized membrane protein